MFIVISVPQIYPACHTDKSEIKQGSICNLTVVDERVFGYGMFDLLVEECFKNVKTAIFFIQVKIIKLTYSYSPASTKLSQVQNTFT